MTKNLIDEVVAQCLGGAGLGQNEMLTLLALDPLSNECLSLRRAAHEAALAITKGRVYLWGAIGVDFAPCSMSCDFCALGAKWRLIKKPFIASEVDILAQVKYYVKNGVYFVGLRGTEFFSVETMLRLVRKIRQNVAGTYEIVLNIGDLTIPAQTLYEAGVNGLCHALRLREGSHTRFNPLKRLETLNAVRKSPLKLLHMVEPIGPEHTDAELADIFLNALDYDVAVSGAMARIPVKGTPLGNAPAISEARLAQIIAVLRLAGGYRVPNICVHPASYAAVTSGANVVMVETGAIPRDRHYNSQSWQRFDVKAAQALLRKAGYHFA